MAGKSGGRSLVNPYSVGTGGDGGGAGAAAGAVVTGAVTGAVGLVLAASGAAAADTPSPDAPDVTDTSPSGGGSTARVERSAEPERPERRMDFDFDRPRLRPVEREPDEPPVTSALSDEVDDAPQASVERPGAPGVEPVRQVVPRTARSLPRPSGSGSVRAVAPTEPGTDEVRPTSPRTAVGAPPSETRAVAPNAPRTDAVESSGTDAVVSTSPVDDALVPMPPVADVAVPSRVVVAAPVVPGPVAVATVPDPVAPAPTADGGNHGAPEQDGVRGGVVVPDGGRSDVTVPDAGRGDAVLPVDDVVAPVDPVPSPGRTRPRLPRAATEGLPPAPVRRAQPAAAPVAQQAGQPAARAGDPDAVAVDPVPVAVDPGDVPDLLDRGDRPGEATTAASRSGVPRPPIASGSSPDTGGAVPGDRRGVPASVVDPDPLRVDPDAAGVVASIPDDTDPADPADEAPGDEGTPTGTTGNAGGAGAVGAGGGGGGGDRADDARDVAPYRPPGNWFLRPWQPDDRGGEGRRGQAVYLPGGQVPEDYLDGAWTRVNSLVDTSGAGHVGFGIENPAYGSLAVPIGGSPPDAITTPDGLEFRLDADETTLERVRLPEGADPADVLDRLWQGPAVQQVDPRTPNPLLDIRLPLDGCTVLHCSLDKNGNLVAQEVATLPAPEGGTPVAYAIDRAGVRVADPRSAGDGSTLVVVDPRRRVMSVLAPDGSRGVVDLGVLGTDAVPLERLLSGDARGNGRGTGFRVGDTPFRVDVPSGSGVQQLDPATDFPVGSEFPSPGALPRRDFPPTTGAAPLLQPRPGVVPSIVTTTADGATVRVCSDGSVLCTGRLVPYLVEEPRIGGGLDMWDENAPPVNVYRTVLLTDDGMLLRPGVVNTSDTDDALRRRQVRVLVGGPGRSAALTVAGYPLGTGPLSANPGASILTRESASQLQWPLSELRQPFDGAAYATGLTPEGDPFQIRQARSADGAPVPDLLLGDEGDAVVVPGAEAADVLDQLGVPQLWNPNATHLDDRTGEVVLGGVVDEDGAKADVRIGLFDLTVDTPSGSFVMDLSSGTISRRLSDGRLVALLPGEEPPRLRLRPAPPAWDAGEPEPELELDEWWLAGDPQDDPPTEPLFLDPPPRSVEDAGSVLPEAPPPVVGGSAADPAPGREDRDRAETPSTQEGSGVPTESGTDVPDASPAGAAEGPVRGAAAPHPESGGTRDDSAAGDEQIGDAQATGSTAQLGSTGGTSLPGRGPGGSQGPWYIVPRGDSGEKELVWGRPEDARDRPEDWARRILITAGPNRNGLPEMGLTLNGQSPVRIDTTNIRGSSPDGRHRGGVPPELAAADHRERPDPVPDRFPDVPDGLVSIDGTQFRVDLPFADRPHGQVRDAELLGDLQHVYTRPQVPHELQLNFELTEPGSGGTCVNCYTIDGFGNAVERRVETYPGDEAGTTWYVGEDGLVPPGGDTAGATPITVRTEDGTTRFSTTAPDGVETAIMPNAGTTGDDVAGRPAAPILRMTAGGRTVLLSRHGAVQQSPPRYLAPQMHPAADAAAAAAAGWWASADPTEAPPVPAQLPFTLVHDDEGIVRMPGLSSTDPDDLRRRYEDFTGRRMPEGATTVEIPRDVRTGEITGLQVDWAGLVRLAQSAGGLGSTLGSSTGGQAVELRAMAGDDPDNAHAPTPGVAGRVGDEGISATTLWAGEQVEGLGVAPVTVPGLNLLTRGEVHLGGLDADRRVVSVVPGGGVDWLYVQDPFQQYRVRLDPVRPEVGPDGSLVYVPLPPLVQAAPPSFVQATDPDVPEYVDVAPDQVSPIVFRHPLDADGPDTTASGAAPSGPPDPLGSGGAAPDGAARDPGADTPSQDASDAEDGLDGTSGDAPRSGVSSGGQPWFAPHTGSPSPDGVTPFVIRNGRSVPQRPLPAPVSPPVGPGDPADRPGAPVAPGEVVYQYLPTADGLPAFQLLEQGRTLAPVPTVRITADALTGLPRYTFTADPSRPGAPRFTADTARIDRNGGSGWSGFVTTLGGDLPIPVRDPALPPGEPAAAGSVPDDADRPAAGEPAERPTPAQLRERAGRGTFRVVVPGTGTAAGTGEEVLVGYDGPTTTVMGRDYNTTEVFVPPYGGDGHLVCRIGDCVYEFDPDGNLAWRRRVDPDAPPPAGGQEPPAVTGYVRRTPAPTAGGGSAALSGSSGTWVLDGVDGSWTYLPGEPEPRPAPSTTTVQLVRDAEGRLRWVSTAGGVARTFPGQPARTGWASSRYPDGTGRTGGSHEGRDGRHGWALQLGADDRGDQVLSGVVDGQQDLHLDPQEAARVFDGMGVPRPANPVRFSIGEDARTVRTDGLTSPTAEFDEDNNLVLTYRDGGRVMLPATFVPGGPPAREPVPGGPAALPPVPGRPLVQRGGEWQPMTDAELADFSVQGLWSADPPQGGADATGSSPGDAPLPGAGPTGGDAVDEGALTADSSDGDGGGGEQDDLPPLRDFDTRGSWWVRPGEMPEFHPAGERPPDWRTGGWTQLSVLETPTGERRAFDAREPSAERAHTVDLGEPAPLAGTVWSSTPTSEPQRIRVPVLGPLFSTAEGAIPFTLDTDMQEPFDGSGFLIDPTAPNPLLRFTIPIDGHTRLQGCLDADCNMSIQPVSRFPARAGSTSYVLREGFLDLLGPDDEIGAGDTVFVVDAVPPPGGAGATGSGRVLTVRAADGTQHVVDLGGAGTAGAPAPTVRPTGGATPSAPGTVRIGGTTVTIGTSSDGSPRVVATRRGSPDDAGGVFTFTDDGVVRAEYPQQMLMEVEPSAARLQPWTWAYTTVTVDEHGLIAGRGPWAPGGDGTARLTARASGLPGSAGYGTVTETFGQPDATGRAHLYSGADGTVAGGTQRGGGTFSIGPVPGAPGLVRAVTADGAEHHFFDLDVTPWTFDRTGLDAHWNPALTRFDPTTGEMNLGGVVGPEGWPVPVVVNRDAVVFEHGGEEYALGIDDGLLRWRQDGAWVPVPDDHAPPQLRLVRRADGDDPRTDPRPDPNPDDPDGAPSGPIAGDDWLEQLRRAATNRRIAEQLGNTDPWESGDPDDDGPSAREPSVVTLAPPATAGTVPVPFDAGSEGYAPVPVPGLPEGLEVQVLPEPGDRSVRPDGAEEGASRADLPVLPSDGGEYDDMSLDELTRVLADPNDILRRAEAAAEREERERLQALRDGSVLPGPRAEPVDPRDSVLTFPGGTGEVPQRESFPDRDPELEGLVGHTEPFPGVEPGRKPEPVFTAQGATAGQRGASRVNPRTGAEEQFERRYALRGDGHGPTGEVLEYRRPGGGRTLLVDPASSEVRNGVEVVYLPTFADATVVATNPAAGRIALEVQVPDGASTSPTGHRPVSVRRGPTTTDLAGIPGGSAGRTQQFATQDPLVERVVVSPSEREYGYAGTGFLRTALVPRGRQAAFRAGQREFWVPSGTPLETVTVRVEPQPEPPPAPVAPEAVVPWTEPAGAASPAFGGDPGAYRGPRRTAAEERLEGREPVTSGASSPAFEAEDLSDGRINIYDEGGNVVGEEPIDPVQREMEGHIYLPIPSLAPGGVGAGAAAGAGAVGGLAPAW